LLFLNFNAGRLMLKCAPLPVSSDAQEAF